MMEELTAQKVNKCLFWVMISFFLMITYLNFHMFFHQIVQFLVNLPFWFLLTASLLIIFLTLHLIHMNEYEIKALESSLSDKQMRLMEMERKMRLINQDLKEVSPKGFKFYCADILKANNYREVKIGNHEGVDIEAINPEGIKIYAKCFSASIENSRDQIHQLYYKMLQEGITKGIILSYMPFTEEEENWAAAFNIEYFHGKKIDQVVQGFLDVDMSHLTSWI